jgi:hypothetical protein
LQRTTARRRMSSVPYRTRSRSRRLPFHCIARCRYLKDRDATGWQDWTDSSLRCARAGCTLVSNLRPCRSFISCQVPMDAASCAFVLARLAQVSVIPSYISILLKSGDVPLTILPDLLNGLSSIKSLALMTPSALVLRDSQDRSRRLRVWDEYQRLSLIPLWTALARSHGTQKTISTFEVGTAAWVGLSEALSRVPSIARHVTLVVRPDSMLLARPTLATAGRSSSSSGSWASSSRLEGSKNSQQIKSPIDDLDLESFEVPQGPAAKVLVVPDLALVKVRAPMCLYGSLVTALTYSDGRSTCDMHTTYHCSGEAWFVFCAGYSLARCCMTG